MFFVGVGDAVLFSIVLAELEVFALIELSREPIVSVCFCIREAG